MWLNNWKSIANETTYILCESESRLVMSDSLQPHAVTVLEIPQARILEWVAFPFSGDLPNPGIEPRSPALQVDSLPAEPQGKPNFL